MMPTLIKVKKAPYLDAFLTWMVLWIEMGLGADGFECVTLEAYNSWLFVC